jgi:hypothetical protein
MWEIFLAFLEAFMVALVDALLASVFPELTAAGLLCF